MLKEFEYEQPYVCKLLNNVIVQNKPSHAYLFEINGYYNYQKLITSFVKELMIKGIEDEKMCDLICSKIDENIFTELKIIIPDGSTIKKEQIEELQQEFKNKSVESYRKIYVIYEAEKMNISSANALLKFLEEPLDNIIAILVTNNSYQILPTIKSRCQIVKLKKTLDESIGLTESLDLENFDKVVSFIEYYEKNKLNSLVYIKKLWHNFFVDKESVEKAVKVMINFYKDVLNFKIDNFNSNRDYLNYIKEIADLNTAETLIKKINLLIDLEHKIRFNVNLSLFMDKLIIEFGKIDG